MGATEESRLDFYRRWSSLSRPYFKWQIDQFSGYTGKRIGDVGCGVGSFVEFFKEKERYVGFDPDGELLQEFRQRHKGSSIYLAQHGDICSNGAVEEIKTNNLDTLICVNVLEHIKDDRQAVAGMVEGIRPGGRVDELRVDHQLGDHSIDLHPLDVSRCQRTVGHGGDRVFCVRHG